MYAVKIINIYDDVDEVTVTPKGLTYSEANTLTEKLEKCLQEPYFVTMVAMDGTLVTADALEVSYA